MRSRKLDLALRRYQGSKMMPSFLQGLEMKLDRSKDTMKLLDLETTDMLFELYKEKARVIREGSFF